MNSQGKIFTGPIPELYDSLLVPFKFEKYARDLATRAAKSAPESVLETAAGSGVVTRALAPRLPGGANYVVTDLNPAMLERARAQQPPDAANGARITWQDADALNLPFDDESFDVVLCQFGAMFFPDKPAGFAETLRVLKPGGRFLFNCWDRIGANPFSEIITRAAEVVYPKNPPDFFRRLPHGYCDPKVITADLRAGGFTGITFETVIHTASADSAHEVAVAFCQGTPLRLEIEALGPDALDRVTLAATQALEQVFGPGRVSGPVSAHVFEAKQL